MNEKEILRCLSKAKERICNIFSEAHDQVEDGILIDLTLLELSLIEALFESFGYDEEESCV